MGPIISRLFTCSNEEIKNKNKKQRVLALVLSLWVTALAKWLSENPQLPQPLSRRIGHRPPMQCGTQLVSVATQ
jgi:hypothetical protein